MGPADAIRDLLGPPLAAAGLELWDVEVAAGVVRVLVDRGGGVDLDALSDATGVVSTLLDEHPALTPSGRYDLEVSSPGLERTLRTPEHHRRYVGQVVAIKTSAPVAGHRRLRGTLVAVEEASVTIAADDAAPGSEPLVVPISLVQRTRTVLEWGPTSKVPTSTARKAAAKAAARRTPTTPQPEDARP